MPPFHPSRRAVIAAAPAVAALAVANALDGHDDPNRGPVDRAEKAIDRNL